MPPKRRTQNTTDGPPPKKQKLDACVIIDDVASSEDDLPVCQYDGMCYRKNDIHWKEFRYYLLLMVVDRSDISNRINLLSASQ